MKRSVLLLAALLAACQSMPDQYSTQFQHEGKPPAYIAGHNDGCSSGLNAAGNPYNKTTKDPQRFKDDPMYAQGWTDGFSTCKDRYHAITHY